MPSEESNIRNGLRKSLEQQMYAASDDERELMAQFIENELSEFILSFWGSNFNGIFRNTKSTYYDTLRKSIATNPAAKSQDEANGNLYSKALILYSNFLSSKFFPRQKLKVINDPSAKTEPSFGPVKTSYVEGAVVQQTVDIHERNSEARRAAIERDGAICQVCGFDFKERYGDLGAGYIEVHHTKPISSFGDEHDVAVDDLVCLCANCHAMAHRRHPEPFTVEELKRMLRD